MSRRAIVGASAVALLASGVGFAGDADSAKQTEQECANLELELLEAIEAKGRGEPSPSAALLKARAAICVKDLGENSNLGWRIANKASVL